MQTDAERELVNKVKQASGENFTLREILEYTRRAGYSPQQLQTMSGEDIVQIILQELNRAYRMR